MYTHTPIHKLAAVITSSLNKQIRCLWRQFVRNGADDDDLRNQSASFSRARFPRARDKTVLSSVTGSPLSRLVPRRLETPQHTNPMLLTSGSRQRSFGQRGRNSGQTVACAAAVNAVVVEHVSASMFNLSMTMPRTCSTCPGSCPLTCSTCP